MPGKELCEWKMPKPGLTYQMLLISTLSSEAQIFPLISSKQELTFQEDACRRSSGICADEVQCVRDGGITSPRKCPTQPSGIKCCVQGELQLDSWKTMDLGEEE